MKKLLSIVLCFLCLLSFSQKNFNAAKFSDLKDVNSIKLDNNDFIGKYTLVFNVNSKTDIKTYAKYFKEVDKIYKNAFFNGIENKGLTVLFFLHSNKINYNEFPVLDNTVVIPVYSNHNSKILSLDKAFCKHQNILINSTGKSVAFDFNPSDLRIGLTKYLKRE
tara:strand:+ start:1775 stop:2266 length:492 start_codon:yes stop_codon:yes gene_type:complete